MDKKLYIFLLSCSMVGGVTLDARYLHHMSVFKQTELINGVTFSHSMTSDQGATKEEYYIDGMPVQKEEFYKELEMAQMGDLRKEREKTDKKNKSRIDVVDEAQLAIVKKLLLKKLDEVKQSIEMLHHDHLKQYYVYDKASIESLQRLLDMKQFVMHTAPAEIKELVEKRDVKGLQQMLDSMESWPDRLDLFFKNSVQNAVKNCDDTAVLKDLLTLLSQ